MKKATLFILFASFISNAFSQCADTVNIFEFTFNGKTYEIVKERKAWDAAAACAQERGGYLVEINDKAEQDTIHSAIINGAGVSTTYVSVNNGGGIAYVWIGATDKKLEGTWLWDGNNDDEGINFWTGQGTNGANNGRAINGAYNNWGGTSTRTPKEPDNYGSAQDHGAIGLTGWPAGTTMLGIPGEWNDIIGSSSLYFVIEYDSTSAGIVTYKEAEFEVYPNPTKGILNVKGNGIVSIEIVDITGKTISYSNPLAIDLSNYKKGSYFLKIETKEGIFTRTIIKE
ncbi:MAG: T9SS type A sorting domain-containing protein [Bacteroidota bacterium]|nr:T9SS type A sorting domain-containing protein [Bacteroidota bacterium]